MKMLLTMMIALAAVWCKGMPSTNTFVAVTNDWYNANFTNVYELAQQRMANNSNDVVAAYLMLEWDTAFGSVASVSNSMTRVIELSDTVTNECFRTPYLRLRGACLAYRDEFLPTVNEADVEAERYKSYLPHKMMIQGYMLELLVKAGLW